MIVVADTSPLNYLIQIGAEELLPTLDGSVVIPQPVLAELGHKNSGPIVSRWVIELPPWVTVESGMLTRDATLAFLDIGEREAIQLAEERRADLLLIDDRKGKAEAIGRGPTTTGTLGVLLAVGKLGLRDPAMLFHRLISETNSRSIPPLRRGFLSALGTRNATRRNASRAWAWRCRRRCECRWASGR